MFKQLFTLARGKSVDASQSFLDANAISLLRQQMRDAASGVEKSRKAVAVVMAYCEREKASLVGINAKITDLENRAQAALDKGREDLAIEAAQVIANLEAERTATMQTIATYTRDITRLRTDLSKSEAILNDLKRGQRIAEATNKTQKLRGDAPSLRENDLSDASDTLKRLQERHAHADATMTAMDQLSAQNTAESVSARLADAGMGEPLSTSAQDVLARLKKCDTQDAR